MIPILHCPIASPIGLLVFDAWVAILFIISWPSQMDTFRTRRDKHDDHL
jgi:hypothetical protein